MEKVNFNAIKKNVSTQYGDLTGVIQIDGHMNISSIYELCKDYNIDTENKFIIGFGLSEFSIDGIGKMNSTNCSILYLDSKLYGNTYDEIEKIIKNDSTLKVNKITFTIKYSDLGKFIKRYDFLVTNELTKFCSTIEFKEIEI